MCVRNSPCAEKYVSIEIAVLPAFSVMYHPS